MVAGMIPGFENAQWPRVRVTGRGAGASSVCFADRFRKWFQISSAASASAVFGLVGSGQGGRVSVVVTKRGRSRALIVLFLAVAVLLVLLVGYWLLGRLLPVSGGNEPAAAAVAQEQVSIWGGYGLALKAAALTAPDAQLVSAGSQWRSVTEEQLLAGANTWSFVFYSPQRSTTLDVVASGAGARVVKETDVWRRPKLLTGDAWRKGPQNALLVFLAYGGRELIAGNPAATVDLHLAARDDGRTTWTVVGLGDPGQAPNMVQVDAETNEVLLNSFGRGE